jgi:LysR family hydrogen peroxide-inducible transcriptional activator
MASITQLEYIIAVADHRHFGKAARACHISQPTLSQQIQKVEDLCDIIIFDRIKKPLVLTLEGHAFLKQARVIVREHKRLLEMTRQTQGMPVGDFRLAIIPTVAPALIPLFIAHFSENYPKINLYVDELKTESILEELRNDRLDAALMATPLRETGLIEDPLYYENFLLYLSAKHPLTKKTAISEADLDGSEMWLLQDGHCFKDQVVKFCSIKKNEFSILKNIHFQSGNLDTLRAVVRHGSGYTMIPSLMAMNLSPKEIGDQVRSFRAPIPSREISLVYRRDYWKQHLVSALKQSILDCLPAQVELQKSKRIQVLEAC